MSGIGVASSQLINHLGNCDLNLNGVGFTGGSVSAAYCINKSSTGTITITGNLLSGAVGSNTSAFNSTNGNTIVYGNVTGNSNSGGTAYGIGQSAGNVTVIGNVTGGSNASTNTGINLTGPSSVLTVIGNIVGGGSTNSYGINFTGVSGSITGNITGGSGITAHGINTTAPLIITGDINGGVGSGISSAANLNIIGNITGGSTGNGVTSISNISINTTGTVAASSTALGISSTGTNSVINLSGNMLNVNGKQAIYAQTLFISNSTTSQWRLFTSGSQNKTLYSADTFPNLPSGSDIRSGSLYGPSNTLTGSMIVPAASDVRVNVPVDNTVGTATSLTAADFLNEISSSNSAVAVRLKNIATDDSVGSLITGFNNGGF